MGRDASDQPPRLNSLGIGWAAAFAQAWASLQAGNFGIGAALVDPVAATLVSVGRNRVAQTQPALGVLSGNMAAHAEMNTFAALDRFNADGLHLFTTLQPCLMCAASAMQLKVAHVSYAADDEFFAGLDDLWQHHPVTAERRPRYNGPVSGRHGAARALCTALADDVHAGALSRPISSCADTPDSSWLGSTG